MQAIRTQLVRIWARGQPRAATVMGLLEEARLARLRGDDDED